MTSRGAGGCATERGADDGAAEGGGGEDADDDRGADEGADDDRGADEGADDDHGADEGADDAGAGRLWTLIGGVWRCAAAFRLRVALFTATGAVELGVRPGALGAPCPSGSLRGVACGPSEWVLG